MFQELLGTGFVSWLIARRPGRSSSGSWRSQLCVQHGGDTCVCCVQVASVVIGCRFGITEHFVDMRRALAGSWVLDEIDLEMLEEATAKRQDLLLTIGDVGDEYR